MNKQNDALYTRWYQWFEILENEILNLVEQRYIYNEVQQIIKGNKSVQSPADFNFWMSIWYSSSMSVAVRKLADRDNKTISYRRLLEGIKKHPTVLSRTRFKSNFVGGSYSEADADEAFDSIAGVRQEYLDLNRNENEIIELEKIVGTIKCYVDKKIAHLEDKENITIPKFSDLDTAIDFFGNLHKRYHLIFTGYALIDLLPVWHYDWKSIFCHAWISN